MEMTYRIRPKEVNREGKALIRLDLHWHDQRLRMSARKFCRPENFDPQGKKLIKTSEENSLALNWELTQLRQDISSLFLELERERKPITAALFKQRIEVLLNVVRAAPVAAPKKTIWDYHAQWLEIYKGEHSHNYLRKFHGVKLWLDQYAPDLLLEDIDEEWVQRYKQWMLVTPSLRTGKTPRNGTVGKHLAFFKCMLDFARLPSKWLKNDYTENTPGVDLYYPEVMALYEKDYLFEWQREVADVYVFLTQVALRFSDYYKLAATDVQRVELASHSRLVIYDYRQGKTAQPVTLVFSALAEAIWDKYQGLLPKFPNAKFNEYLKEVGQCAGLKRPVTITTAHGREYRSQVLPLYKALTVHTARHTCACLLREGSKGQDLAQLTLGQQARSSTNIYARAKQLDQINETLDAWSSLEQKYG